MSNVTKKPTLHELENMHDAEILELRSVVVDEKGHPIPMDEQFNFCTIDIFYYFAKTQLLFYVIDYRENGEGSKKIKFGGGTSSNKKNETVEETHWRESEEYFLPQTEENQDKKTGSLKKGAYDIIYTKASGYSITNPQHLKVFFLNHEWVGEFRETTTDKGENSAPYLMAGEDLAAVIHPTHWTAFERSIEAIEKKYGKESRHHLEAITYVKLAMQRAKNAYNEAKKSIRKR